MRKWKPFEMAPKNDGMYLHSWKSRRSDQRLHHTSSIDHRYSDQFLKRKKQYKKGKQSQIISITKPLPTLPFLGIPQAPSKCKVWIAFSSSTDLNLQIIFGHPNWTTFESTIKEQWCILKRQHFLNLLTFNDVNSV